MLAVASSPYVFSAASLVRLAGARRARPELKIFKFSTKTIRIALHAQVAKKAFEALASRSLKGITEVITKRSATAL